MPNFALSRGAIAVAALVAGLAACSTSQTPQVAARSETPGTADGFELVGHNALMNRGMNAAPALYDHYIYVGSRTDGQPQHLDPGVQVVDIADPAKPEVVGQVPPTSVDPMMAVGYTSRELRVWQQQGALIVMYFGCSAIIHDCVSGQDAGEQPFQQMALFDVSGANGAAPRLVSIYKPSRTPHEMFLWIDPAHAGRALLYWTSPNDGMKSLVVTDLSQWRSGTFPEIGGMNTAAKFTASQATGFDVRLHSISVSPDGTRTYLAHLGGGFLVLDSSDFANEVASPKFRFITPTANRVFWDNQGAHSSVLIPGTHYALTTEEIYGRAFNAAFGAAMGGCPWGWVRIIDVADETAPKLAAEYKLAENEVSFCANVPPQQNDFSSYASHNPTVLRHLAFVTWHSGGLQAIDLTDPAHPARAGSFLPTPEPISVTPDPALEPGSNNVIAWSYPIIKDGLIYFIDIRNGLYVVRYNGVHADEVAKVGFLEGNSSL